MVGINLMKTKMLCVIPGMFVLLLGLTGCIGNIPPDTGKQAAYEFKNFGTMIPEAGGALVIHGPGKSGKIDTIYMMFNNAKGSWFMVAVDTNTGQSVQYFAPEHDTNRATACVGPDNKIYVGTVGEQSASNLAGRVYVFDPKNPDKGIVSLGKPSQGDGYFFGLTGAPDGKIYMGSYGNCKLLAYNPADGAFTDYGPVVDDEMYSSSIAPASEEFVYVGVGVSRYRIIRVNLKNGVREEVRLADETEEYTKATGTYLGIDGNIYCRLGKKDAPCIIEGLVMRPLAEGEKPAPKYGVHTIKDYTFNYDWDNRIISFTKSDGVSGMWKFDYTGAAAHLFMLRKGPDDLLLGSSDLPLRLFSFDLKTRAHRNLRNPNPKAGGEIYSIHQHNPTQVYMGSYPLADMIVWDPTKPWETVNGRAQKEGTNPIGLGYLGDEQNRPYDMITGPDGFVYVCTTATYGAVGGAITKLDPNTNTWKIFRYPVGNHAISKLCRVPGDERHIAGGTLSAATGYKLGAFGDAKLFYWDTKEDTVAAIFDLPIEKAQYLLQLEPTKDGMLIGTCGKGFTELYLFAFDTKTREFIHVDNISELVNGYIWETNKFSKPYKGKIYFTNNSNIYTIDIKTFEIDVIAHYEGAKRGTVIARDPVNNRMALYFITESELVAMYLEP